MCRSAKCEQKIVSIWCRKQERLAQSFHMCQWENYTESYMSAEDSRSKNKLERNVALKQGEQFPRRVNKCNV